MSKKGIDIGASVIDPDYRGEIKALLINNSATEIKIQKHDCIAQAILEKSTVPIVEEVKELGETERGMKGFGSTNNVQNINNDMLAFEGKINKHFAKVLIDSGSSGNFIREEFARKSKIPTYKKKDSYEVRLADKTTLPVKNFIPLAKLEIQDHTETINLDALPLEGNDVILGKPWLRKHNPNIDWKKNEIIIQGINKKVTLEKDPAPRPPTIPQISVIQANKAIKHGEMAFLLLIKDEQHAKEILTDDKKLQELLQEYQDTFPSELPGLPPHRSVDHA